MPVYVPARLAPFRQQAGGTEGGRRSRGNYPSEDLAQAVSDLTACGGFSRAEVMAMTPRQIRTEHLLMMRRRLHDMAAALTITAIGTHSDSKAIKRQIETWERM